MIFFEERRVHIDGGESQFGGYDGRMDDVSHATRRAMSEIGAPVAPEKKPTDPKRDAELRDFVGFLDQVAPTQETKEKSALRTRAKSLLKESTLFPFEKEFLQRFVEWLSDPLTPVEKISDRVDAYPELIRHLHDPAMPNVSTPFIEFMTDLNRLFPDNRWFHPKHFKN